MHAILWCRLVCCDVRVGVLGVVECGVVWSGVRRACEGAQDVVARLSARCKRVRLGVSVSAICPLRGAPSGPCAGVHVHDSEGECHVFDHVVFATQANHAADILSRECPLHCRAAPPSLDVEYVSCCRCSLRLPLSLTLSLSLSLLSLSCIYGYVLYSPCLLRADALLHHC